MNTAAAKQQHYGPMTDRSDRNGVERLGLSTNYAWNDDPKRLAFTLARYKFVAKMLEGKGTALEVGCGDAFGTRIVQQAVGQVFAIDHDDAFIADARSRASREWPITLHVHDILDAAVLDGDRMFDAAYALDVIEHINPADEGTFLRNIAGSIRKNGVVIIGAPSLASQHLASPLSKRGHVNCKDGPAMRNTLALYFENVFMFAMNDEVVHTGHHAMAHYLIAVCAGVRPCA